MATNRFVTGDQLASVEKLLLAAIYATYPNEYPSITLAKGTGWLDRKMRLRPI